MSKVRILVGTHKGAFILTSDGRRENWEISEPQFAGWEIYHLQSSPATPLKRTVSQRCRRCHQMVTAKIAL
jgi:hypothetical protein